MADERKAQVIPFGKHRGKCVEDLFNEDPQYLEWLTAQAWFAERFADLHRLITQGDRGEAAETPEHNRLQIKFLDATYRSAFILAAQGYSPSDTQTAEGRLRVCQRLLHSVDVGFETFGADVLLHEWCKAWDMDGAQQLDAQDAARFTAAIGEPPAADIVVRKRWGQRSTQLGSWHVEIKPSLGEDYPAVLRQVLRTRQRVGRNWRDVQSVVLAGTLSLSVTTEQQLRDFLRHANILLVLDREVEALKPLVAELATVAADVTLADAQRGETAVFWRAVSRDGSVEYEPLDMDAERSKAVAWRAEMERRAEIEQRAASDANALAVRRAAMQQHMEALAKIDPERAQRLEQETARQKWAEWEAERARKRAAESAQQKTD